MPTSFITFEASLASPPFIKNAGLFNVRDIGGYPINSPPGLSQKRSVTCGIVFRSAAPHTPHPVYRLLPPYPITDPTPTVEGTIFADASQPTFESFNPRIIFDLRSPDETQPEPPYFVPPSMTRRQVPIYSHKVSPKDLERRYLEYMSEGSPAGFVDAYREILRDGAKAIRVVFSHIHDHPTSSILIHCSGGKDRTGVVSALALKLAGVEDRFVARDYHLSDSGIPSELREHAIANFTTMAVNGDMGLMWQALAGGRCDPHYPPDPKRVRAAMERMAGAKEVSMLATLEMLEKEFGGAEGYLRGQCGFSEAEVRVIQDHLTSEAVPIF